MLRTDMINVVGREFITANIENDEFNYVSAYKRAGKKFTPIYSSTKRSKYERLDIRFVKGDVSVLIETKTDFSKDSTAEEQLSAYVQYEKNLTGNKIVAILANTDNDKIKVWRGVIADSNLLTDEDTLKPIDEYVDIYNAKVNNKEKVMKNTYELNELLHRNGISEKLRSQFVGTCLLALKNNLLYEFRNTTVDGAGKTKKQIEKEQRELDSRVNDSIRNDIKKVLSDLLTKDINKATKITLLNNNILENQDIRNLDAASFIQILDFIKDKILPFINDKSTAGQDLLNLFFITFNKYVGKADKNQAFTPDHITDFMCKVTGVNKNTRVLDPCCGSGAFLVRAMTQALEDCSTKEEQDKVKKDHIYGIEYDENVYGLATTNMLIHGDGNSNIMNNSCFNLRSWIKTANPDIILMNPPYNAQKKHLPDFITKDWKARQKEDSTKGLCFVKYIADVVCELNKQAKLAVILPLACAIGTSNDIKTIKREILKNNTLDAVFTLPDEVFYPGASVNSCCMVFTLGKKHNDATNPKTFFGYFKDDGFKKKKNIGRVEQLNKETNESLWTEKEQKWLELYKERETVDGLSVTYQVTGDDEWLCEAYMKTDYSTLKPEDFQEVLNNYLAFRIKEGYINSFNNNDE